MSVGTEGGEEENYGSPPHVPGGPHSGYPLALSTCP